MTAMYMPGATAVGITYNEGVVFGRKPIAGSCGGLKTMGEIGDCEICGGDPAKCK